MSILDKIRKLRALAESDNVNEAAAAAAAAERLIQEYNIAEAEIPLAQEEPCFLDSDPIAAYARKILCWEEMLLSLLSRQYHCKGVFDCNRFKVAGRPSDVATLRYQFAFFTSEINRLAAKLGRGKGRTWANSFRIRSIEVTLVLSEREAKGLKALLGTCNSAGDNAWVNEVFEALDDADVFAAAHQPFPVINLSEFKF